MDPNNRKGEMVASKDGRVATMTFDNPARHNAVSLEMWQSAAKILDDFAADAAVRVVVLAGAGGKAFVSGADISRFEDERATREAVRTYNAATETVYSRIAAYPKPVIAKIQGYCIGGGLNLAISCDLRFCSESSRFSLPAARLGLGYGYAGLKRFIDTIGPSHTKDIFLSARQFGPAEALSMGLVNRVLPDADLDAFVKDYAEGIAANAPLTVEAIKQISTEVSKPESERDLDRAARLVDRCFASDDYVEGRRAFMEKRKPAFTGK
jgi:enoyl-CoA hydratase